MKKNKTNNMAIYRIFRGVLEPLYRFWYKPQIVGKENIPESGPIVVVGNHIHIMDQCNPIGVTKRCIHYMAKKEYFDPKYKEGKFPWFFRSAGCIPVDRSIHDDSAKSSAIEVLEEGHALGLFPEGTRNGLKEARAKEVQEKYFKDANFEEFYKKAKSVKTSEVDYCEELIKNKKIKEKDFIDNFDNLDSYLRKLAKDKVISEDDYYDHIFLPFKFGAVSMAQKTGALVVPFVTTGEYKFRSKNLKVRIGKPILIGHEEDLEKANKELRKTMIELYKKNEK